MSQPSIIHVVGNRPQFIKLAVLHDAIEKQNKYDQFIIHTGQHGSGLMSEVFFKDLAIPDPDAQLDIHADSADEFIGKTATRIVELLRHKDNDGPVLVYGDTNSTLAAAIAAKRSERQLIHFESGVRTKDNSMPEEINRILTDRLSDVHYSCTADNKENLLKEGYGSAIPSAVVWTGDLMLDAFLHIAPSEKKVTSSKNYIACTIHRASNIVNRKSLNEIAGALNEIHKNQEVIIPLHPHTAKRLKEFEIDLKCTILDPLGYREMKQFLCESDFVITDSGGASREAFFANKKSLIIMEHPFWHEIIDAGAAIKSVAGKESIMSAFKRLDDLDAKFDRNIFGDGHAAFNIASHLNTLLP